MQIALGLGLGMTFPPFDGAPPSPAPTLALVLSPAEPMPGDLVTLTGFVGGDPVPTGFSALSVTLDGTAVLLTGAGLSRQFLAQGGTLDVAATVSTTEGSATASLSAQIATGGVVASVVGFGSSSMAGSGASSTARRALTLIAAGVGAGTIRNQGVAGTVLQNSFDASGSPRSGNGRDRFAAALLGANRSDRAYIFYGANDLRYTGAPETFNVAAFRTDMAEVLNGLRAGGYARDAIVIGSPNWYPESSYSVGSAGFTGSNRMVHETYVNACLDIAAEYGLPYADVYGKMRDLGGPALVSSDGLHPNDTGHQVIAHAFLTASQANSRAMPEPGAVTVLAVDSLSLVWQAVPGAIGYRVEAGLSGSYAYPQAAEGTGAEHVFAGLAPGTYLARVRALFADGAGPWAFWTTAVTVGGALAAPVMSLPPLVSGTAAAGATLSCSPGDWSGSPVISFGHQWRRNGLVLPGASAPDYVLGADDIGASMECLVTATNGVGSAAALSNAVGPVLASPSEGRVITGASIFAGQTGGALIQDLAASPGAWVRHPGSTGEATLRADGQSLRGQAATSRAALATLASEALTAAGVFVELDYLIRSNNTQLTTYAAARVNPDEVTLIAAGYNGAAWRVLKYVAGTATVLGTFNQVEPVGSAPRLRLEVQSGVQRLYVNEALVLTTYEPDSGLGALGEGLGLRIGSGTTSFTDTVGPQLTAIRVGRLPG